MAISILPIDSADPAYDVDVDLSGTIYRLTVQWNTRGAYWTVGIALVDGTPIVAATKIVPGWSLFEHQQDPRLPAGRIVAIDMTGTGAMPTDESLGSGCLVVYDDGQPE